MYLPDKTEQVLFCELTEGQRRVYEQYLASPEVRECLDDAAYTPVTTTHLKHCKIMLLPLAPERALMTNRLFISSSPSHPPNLLRMGP